MTLRVVVDTNIYLSAILFVGVPAALLLAANRGEFSVLISEHILHEVERKLLDKFEREPAFVRWETQQLRLLAQTVIPTERIQACRDEDDNRILECAIAGSATPSSPETATSSSSNRSAEFSSSPPGQLLDRLTTPPNQ